jgi:hypothetical protein
MSDMSERFYLEASFEGSGEGSITRGSLYGMVDLLGGYMPCAGSVAGKLNDTPQCRTPNDLVLWHSFWFDA